jgi:hypothetical protein
MAEVLEFNFEIWVLAERISVKVPLDQATTKEIAFLDFVSQRFSSLDQAWIAYRKVAPRNGAFFPADSRSFFDEMISTHRAQNPPDPPPTNVNVLPISSEELKAHERAMLCQTKHKAARQTRNEIKTVLHEVVPRLESVAFRSQAGMEALRIAMSLQPISAEQPADGQAGRRAKRKLVYGVTMPAAPPVRRQRQQTADELAQRTDILYVIRAPEGGLAAVAECPAEDSLMVGVVFDLHAQLRVALELDAKHGRLVASRAHAGSAEFEVLLGEDGICPSIEHVLCVAVRLLDPARALFADGHSRMLRLLVAWLPESGVREVAHIRNRALSKLVNDRCDGRLAICVARSVANVFAGSCSRAYIC